jgi:hypothetical protein
MYPLAVLLAAGLIWRDLNTPKYALCLAIPGALASTYHILLQKVPAIAALEACVIGVPCSTDYLNLFGFITIPMLALAAFAIVIVASVFALRTQPALARSPLPFFPPAVLVSLVVATTVGLFALSGMMVRGSRQPTAALPAALPASSADQSAAELYNRACAGCHGPANAGLQLIRAEYLENHSDLEVMRLIRAGRSANDPQNFSGKRHAGQRRADQPLGRAIARPGALSARGAIACSLDVTGATSPVKSNADLAGRRGRDRSASFAPRSGGQPADLVCAACAARDAAGRDSDG